MIYFDNSATTKPYREVVDKIAHISLNDFGNPSSLHSLGLRAEKLVDNARKILANTLHAKPEEILFTSGGTEAINMAIKGSADALKRSGRHILSSPIEHAASLESIKQLESMGFTPEFLAVDAFGKVDLEDVKSKLRPDTILVNIMMVNNETGVIQPVIDASHLIKSHSKAVFHVDAVQAYGKIPIDTRTLKADLISFSAHKIHGPKGVGMLYVRGGTRINPILSGGGQERKLRSGTINVPGIAGFAEAASIKLDGLVRDKGQIKSVRDTLMEALNERLKGQIRINSPEDGLPEILNISFLNVKSEIILHALEMRDIYVSSGSACHSRSGAISHVLQAMNLPRQWADGAIRFSFCGDNTVEEAIQCADALAEIVAPLTGLKK
jgi:cysteine desulfurase